MLATLCRYVRTGAVPKIEAPTVAEHRANQERALLEAARELLLAGGGAGVPPAGGRAADVDGRVDAYVRTTLELAGSGAHRVAVLGGGLPPDARARERLAQAH